MFKVSAKRNVSTLLFLSISFHAYSQCLNTEDCPFDDIPGLSIFNPEYEFVFSCADSYQALTNVQSNQTYKFTIEGKGVPAYITVRQGSFDGQVLGHGLSPLEVTTINNNNIFIHINEDNACTPIDGFFYSDIRKVQCLTCPQIPNPPLGSKVDKIPFKVMPVLPRWQENGYDLEYNTSDSDIWSDFGDSLVYVYFNPPLQLDLSSNDKNIQSVEIDFIDYCGGGATYSEIFFKNGSIDYRYNQTVSVEETFLIDATMEGGIDSINIYGCETFLTEIRIYHIENFGNCPSSLNLDQPTIASGTYLASGTIEATGTIESSGNVTIKAGQIVTLRPPFTAPVGSSLLVQIDDCQPVQANSTPMNTRTSNPVELLTDNYINQENRNFKSIITPNPTTNEVHLIYELKQKEKILINLISVSGKIHRQISNKIEHDSPGVYQYRLDVSTLPKGLYFVHIQTTRNSENKKLIIK
ncbi:MAG: T9SS type A sorting domain-containing protein [Saprospiraceae bacterium]|nr:T9SS type A sorting domain-containing protein [Saprospiraceae bacterium]